MRSSVRLRVVDVVAITAVIGAVASVVAAAGASKREEANRVRCADNLRHIGTAIVLYANENRGAFPRTTYDRDAAPTWGTPYAEDERDGVGAVKLADPYADEKTATKEQLAVKPKANDVTAALFLLIRTQDILPAVFTCPSTTFKPFDYGGKQSNAIEWTNFPGDTGIAKHLSYSYQNPYPSAKAIATGFKLNNSIPAELATMADMKPGGETLMTATLADAPLIKVGETIRDSMRAINSLNHGGDGQNVLFGDGHVEFVNRPFVGIQQDNIYVSGDVGQVRKDGEPAFAASPVDANDSILLPTAAGVGQKPESSDEPIVPIADPAPLLKQLVGKYMGSVAGGPAWTLVVDERTLAMTQGPMTLKYDYQILGKQGGAIVLELTAPATPTSQNAITIEGDSLRFEDGGRMGITTFRRVSLK